jgi:acylglycerol lipase
MNYQTFTLLTNDRKKLFAQGWMPDADAKKLIIILHGLGEHSSRYDSWAQLFTRKGYTVLSMDLRGHGQSEGKRGHAKSINQLLDDIDLLYNFAGETFPGYKLILYGHSMGGTLVLNYIIRRNRPISALIVTSPWLKLVDEPSALLFSVTSILKRLLPSLAVSNRLRAEQISHDPEIVRSYANDPLIHDRITLNMFHTIYNAGYFALRYVYKIRCPFLLMHGTADSIASSKASENYVMNTSRHVRLKLWENQYHELHHEFIRKDVFEYMIRWLDEYDL